MERRQNFWTASCIYKQLRQEINVIELSDEEQFAKAKTLAICESTWNGDPVYRNDRQERRLPFCLRRRFNARDGKQSTEVYLKMGASGVNQWKIGEVKITRVVESEGPWDGSIILPDGTAENVRKESDWLYPVFADENGKLRMAIQALVIESQGKRIIVDTCIGNDKVRSNPEWNKLQLPFLQDLEKIGSPRESIDSV